MGFGPYVWPENRDTLNQATNAHENKPRFTLITHAMKPRRASWPENDTHIVVTHESPGERRDGGAGISVPGRMTTGAGIWCPWHGEDVGVMGWRYVLSERG